MSHVSRVFFAKKNTQDMTRRHIFGALAEAHYISDTSMDSILIIKGIGEFQPFPKDTYMFVHMYVCSDACLFNYGVATVSRIGKITGLLCTISSLL